MQGEVEVWKAYKTPDADILAVHGSGKLFGEMALIDNLPRSATVVSRSNTRVLYVKDDDFKKMVYENANIAISIMKSISNMVRKSNENFLEDLKLRNQALEKAYKDLKEAQDELLLKERLSNLGKFSSMILHDIRNPIAVVKTYVQMILHTQKLPEKSIDYLKNISMEVDRLNNLANEFLDYSRGEIRLDMSIVSVPNFLKRIELLVTRRFASKAVDINIKTDIKDPVIFDEERMFRVLMNLSENARKALGKTGRFIITAKKEKNTIVFAVKDSGVGMNGEVLSHIFEPFYSSSQGGGTGLGMVIVKNIVEAHEGSLDIKSSPGKGTIVKIVLPLRG